MIHWRSRLAVILVLLLATAGCGGSSPSAPTPTPTPSLLLTGRLWCEDPAHHVAPVQSDGYCHFKEGQPGGVAYTLHIPRIAGRHFYGRAEFFQWGDASIIDREANTNVTWQETGGYWWDKSQRGWTEGRVLVWVCEDGADLAEPDCLWLTTYVRID